LTSKEEEEENVGSGPIRNFVPFGPALLDSAESGISDQIFSLIGYEAKLLDRKDLGRELGDGGNKRFASPAFDRKRNGPAGAPDRPKKNDGAAPATESRANPTTRVALASHNGEKANRGVPATFYAFRLA
jgi:hypothetical protein